jgi:repressor LexA
MDYQLTMQQQEVQRFLEERDQRGESPPTYREICKRFGYSSTKAAADQITALERKGFVIREKGRARGIRLVRKSSGIPLLGHITAGFPSTALEESRERLDLDPALFGIQDRSKAFALRVAGDSMIGRQIFDGDIVVLDNTIVPRNGDIVAALIDNECTLKTLVRRGRKVWLRAENPKYPDLIPAADLQIQGVGRAVIRLLNK